jgi:carnitine 3-dehydrogenase
MKCAPGAVRRVACIGAGTIGAGWVALFLARGKEVVAFDPAPAAERRLREHLVRVFDLIDRVEGADPSRLRFAPSLADAVGTADFVQESVPDREELKIKVTAFIGEAADERVVIASSSSEFIPSRIGSLCRMPERCVVGHPFAPSYLLPLVEVVAREGAADVRAWTAEFYRGLGKRVVELRKEHPAYIGNHLLRALGAKANELVESGVCTYADIEEVMVTSLGPRWAVMGPALAFHLAGGEGGRDAAREHFGWSGGEESWRSLEAAVEDLTGGAPVAEVERWRDDVLLRILGAQRPFRTERIR